MLLATIVRVSQEVAGTRSRKAKVAILAACLRQASLDELPVVTYWLAGSLRQRRTGVGWRSLTTAPRPAPFSTVVVSQVDLAFEHLSALGGPGSAATRSAALRDLLEAATADEQGWLRDVLTGAVRQGALDALTQEAIAQAADVPVAAVRRAAMLAGSTAEIAVTALRDGVTGLSLIGLTVGRPILPMLASSATTVPDAMAKLGPGPVSVDAKLDGIRVQVHRDRDQVLIASRSLDDVTARLADVVEVVRRIPARSFVLDGEVIALHADGRPRPFQETSSLTAQTTPTPLTAYFFDLLHLDGQDFLDQPASLRLARLDTLVPAELRVRRLVTDDSAQADRFFAETIAGGHEGVVLKSLHAPYHAGRRGAAWVKVKPVHTLDLVVLAVEEGSGRRRGWLSNIHLGARDVDRGGFVMLGKTFKGMTDEMLAWQTERFTELMVERDNWVVRVRPEQVVEIAFDGLQRSRRYPGGVALRFARVVRYRDDKTAEEADTITTVRSLMG
ncbi:MAG: ATP-dependent DNA ligase [Nocardioides sp.]